MSQTKPSPKGRQCAGEDRDAVTFRPVDAPDQRDGLVYIMSPDVELAVRVALATGRPLLVRGDPGSGKSSLAAYVARQRCWRYYEHVVTSRTHARDLLWTFDAVRRLADAEGARSGAVLDNFAYIEPGILWWAFSRKSARRRGAPDGSLAPRRSVVEPNQEVNKGRSPDHAVVLIDEIDKADPDVPNGLLVPLAACEFLVTETNSLVRKEEPLEELDTKESRHLIVITTNEERELPQAFLRRCVVVKLEYPADPEQCKKWLVAVAKEHLMTYEAGYSKDDKVLVEGLANELIRMREEATRQARRPPSTAEYLDAVRACRTIPVALGTPRWEQLRNLILIKS